MSFYDDESAIGKVYDRRLTGRLGRYVRPYAMPLAVAGVLMLAVAVLELVPILIVRYAIDQQIDKGLTDRLPLLAFWYVAALLASFVIRYLQGYLMAWVGQRVVVDMRMELFRHVQRMSISFFDRNPVGRLVVRLTGDVQQIEAVISQGLVQIFTNLLMVSAIIVAMFVLDWRLATIMTLFVIPLIWLVKIFAAAQRDAFRDQRIWIARINAYLNEMISGVAIVQLFNRQRRNQENFDERNRGNLDANLRVLFWYAVFEPTVVLFGALTTGAILWYGLDKDLAFENVWQVVHHRYTHGLTFVLLTGIVAWLIVSRLANSRSGGTGAHDPAGGRRAWRVALLSMVASALHNFCDIVGGGPTWPVYPLWPLSDFGWSANWSWPLSAWPNTVILFSCLAATLLYAKFAGRSPVELFGGRADRWFASVVQEGSDRAGPAAKSDGAAVGRRVPLRLIIWVLVVLVTIALLAPLGFRLDG